MPSVLLALLLDRHYWRSRSVVSLLSTGLLLNIAGWAWVFLVVRPTSARILLHYTVQGGVDRIGAGTLSYLIPAAALLLLVLNAVGGALLFRFERFLSFFLLSAAIFVQALFFVGAVTITLAAG